jgi:hypothetical protein
MQGMNMKSQFMRFHPFYQSSIVFVGFGESEAFAVFQEYQVGSIAAGKLRAVKSHETSVSRGTSAIVVPRGQRDMIEMFYRGIYPELWERLLNIIGEVAGKYNKTTPENAKMIVDDVKNGLEEEISSRYIAPLIDAVEMLPRHDLATLAEALVSLTAFRARMQVEEPETVGGPIDVAVISKGEGFVWIKRKDPIKDSKWTTSVVLS